MLQLRLVEVHAERDEIRPRLADLLEQRAVSAPEVEHRARVANRRVSELHDWPVRLVHRHRRTEAVVRRIPARGRGVGRNRGLEPSHGTPSNASRRVVPAIGTERRGRRPPRPASGGRAGARRTRAPVASVRVDTFSTGVFTWAMPCSADQDAGQLRISSIHSISAANPRSRPRPISRLAKSMV